MLFGRIDNRFVKQKMGYAWSRSKTEGDERSTSVKSAQPSRHYLKQRKTFEENLQNGMKVPKACFHRNVEVYQLTTHSFLAQSSPSSFEQYIGL